MPTRAFRRIVNHVGEGWGAARLFDFRKNRTRDDHIAACGKIGRTEAFSQGGPSGEVLTAACVATHVEHGRRSDADTDLEAEM